MKRISHISLVLLLLAATTGMTISKHYCGDNLKSVHLLSSPESCCNIPDDCCHDEFITIDIEDDFSVSSYIFEFAQFAVEIPALVELFKCYVPKIVCFNTLSYIPPPPKIQTVLSSLQTYLI